VKVLIIYHAGASLNALSIFNELASVDSVVLSVIAPERLQVDRVYDPTGWLRCIGSEGPTTYRSLPVPLRDPANYQRGFQRQALRAAIKIAEPDIIHVLDEAYSGYLFQVVWERLTVCPKAKIAFYGFDNLPLHFKLHSSLKWRLTWSQMSGGLAANSECLNNLREVGFPSRLPLERVYWGVPTEIFRPMDKRSLKQELGLNFDHLVGFIGRLSPDKGLRVLIDAFRRLPESTHLLLVGSGPMKEELEGLSIRSNLAGRIHIQDAVETSHLVKILNSLDVLCLPSLTLEKWKEQYGRVIAEAMACGIPVVGSDSGAIPEVIGSAGLIVPENDSSLLADALSLALFDEITSERLRREGLMRVDLDLSCKAMARNLYGFYDRILEDQNA